MTQTICSFDAVGSASHCACGDSGRDVAVRNARRCQVGGEVMPFAWTQKPTNAIMAAAVLGLRVAQVADGRLVRLAPELHLGQRRRVVVADRFSSSASFLRSATVSMTGARAREGDRRNSASIRKGSGVKGQHLITAHDEGRGERRWAKGQ